MNGDPTISRRRAEALRPIIDAAMDLRRRERWQPELD